MMANTIVLPADLMPKSARRRTAHANVDGMMTLKDPKKSARRGGPMRPGMDAAFMIAN